VRFDVLTAVQKFLYFWVDVIRRPIFLRNFIYLQTLMMEAVISSETWANVYQTTCHNTPEDSYLHTRGREELKSHKVHTALRPREPTSNQETVLQRNCHHTVSLFKKQGHAYGTSRNFVSFHLKTFKREFYEHLYKYLSTKRHFIFAI
jgi:hypothetical protein